MIGNTKRARMFAAVLGGLLLSACDSGGSQEPPPAPAITVAVGAATAEVLPGGAASLSVNITRSGGYTGAVNLTAETVPAGVTIGAVSIPAGSTTGTLNIVAAANATPTIATVTVRAAGTGVGAQTASFTLTVREPAAFTLAVSPATVVLPAGGSATTSVDIGRTGGFNGAVALTATGAPEGLTVSFNPAAATGATSTVTVTAAAMAAGAHTITIRGNAEGMAERTTTLAVQVAATQAIAISLNPTALSLAQGASGSVTVSLARLAGFAGAVTLTAENVPAGVTVSGATIAAGSQSATLNVTATAAAAAATSSITIRALGTGVADQTATLALTITQAGGYTLGLDPATLAVQQGGSGTGTIGIARTGGFAGAVALSATGAPAGMTVTFNPATVTGDQAGIAVAASAAVAAGTYPIMVRGAATGLPDRQATLNVQVTAGGQTGGNVAFRFCPASGLPVWVAAQNGTGAWTRVTASAGNEYAFQVTTLGGVAYVFNNAGSYELTVQYGTAAELQTAGSALCEAGTGATRTVNGTVLGMGPTDFMAQISMGSATTAVMPFVGSNFQLQNVEPGTVDLVAARIGLTPTGGMTTNRLFVQRNLNPAHNSSVTVDFASASSFAPATANLTLVNLGADHAMVMGAYVTANGTLAVTGLDAETSAATSRQYAGFPADRQAAGDLHFITAYAAAPGSTEPTHQRLVAQAFRTLGERTFTFGPSMSAVTSSTVASQPYARLRLSYPVQAEYNGHFTAEFTQAARDATIQMSAGYLSGAATASLEVPDFTGVAGWDNNWGLRPGAQTSWNLMAMGGGSFLNRPADNTVLRAAVRSGQLTP